MLKKTASFILAVLLSVNNIGTAITVNALDSENTSEVSEIDENMKKRYMDELVLGTLS